MGVINRPEIFKQGDPRIFRLDGLIERRRDGWYWMTGKREPRLIDLPAKFFAPDFLVTEIDGETFIVIPEGFELVMRWDRTLATHALIKQCVEAWGQEIMVPFAAFCTEDDKRLPEQVAGWIVPLNFWNAVMDDPDNPLPGWNEKDFEGLVETASSVAKRISHKRRNIIKLFPRN